MPTCSCGTRIEKLPKWLDKVNVAFRCNKCPGAVVVAPVVASSYAKDEEDLDDDLLAADPADGEDLDEEEEPIDEDAD